MGRRELAALAKALNQHGNGGNHLSHGAELGFIFAASQIRVWGDVLVVGRR